MKSPVPTVEEIRARMTLQKQGVAMPTAQENLILREENKKLEKRAEAVERKALTPLQLKARLDDLFEKYGVEPAEELIQLATMEGPDGNILLSTGDRIKIWAELLAYRMPKLKSVELSGEVDMNLTIKVVKFGTGEVIDVQDLKKAE